jgi:hypothetical protein
MKEIEGVKFVLCSKSGLNYISYEYIRDTNRSLRYVHYKNSPSFFKDTIMKMKPLRLILINIER